MVCYLGLFNLQKYSKKILISFNPYDILDKYVKYFNKTHMFIY